MRPIAFITVIIFLGIHSSVAQKTIEKQFSSAGIRTLSIIDDAIFKITIRASEEESIRLAVHISGEHSENVIVEENIRENTLSLKTGFSPFFLPENDKLAAHKVMAIEIELAVPSAIAIEIKSNLAAVFSQGHFKNLAITLANGTCELQDFSGNAQIQTDDGSILVLAQGLVTGVGTSTYGTVINNLPAQGVYRVVAESTEGNIMLLQTK